MKNSISKLIFIATMIVFVLCQILIRYNTSLLLTDLEDGIWLTSQHLPHSKDVQILIETAKEYGRYKDAYDSSIYYIFGALIVLVLFIISSRKEKKQKVE
jgi:MFS superfamily sulfate permease-like transporter